jgi:hypothetical protein
VAWLLVADAGYPVYPETLAIRADREKAAAPCLRRLVPLIQRSVVSYLTDPVPTNELIVRLVRDFGGYPYSVERAAYAVGAMRDNGIVGNGPNRTVGDFDISRVTKLVEVVRPIFARAGQPLPAEVSPADLVTNAYVDRSVSVG